MTQRRLARECALEVLYRLELVGDEPENTIQELLVRKNPSDEGEAHLRRIVATVQARRREIDLTLRRHLRRWRLERLKMLDRAVLRIGCAEILFFEDVPPKVAINEAVDIAKKFSDDDSGRFVNGVLDGVYRESRPEKPETTDSGASEE